MQYSADRETISPVYDDCPAVCYQDGTRRTEFCDNCEILAAREQYQETAEQQLTEYLEGRPGRVFRKLEFDYLHKCVLDTLRFEKLPRQRLTTTTAALVDILDAERRRMIRVLKWNKANDDSGK